jgi:hypothetical protein
MLGMEENHGRDAESERARIRSNVEPETDKARPPTGLTAYHELSTVVVPSDWQPTLSVPRRRG